VIQHDLRNPEEIMGRCPGIPVHGQVVAWAEFLRMFDGVELVEPGWCGWTAGVPIPQRWMRRHGYRYTAEWAARPESGGARMPEQVGANLVKEDLRAIIAQIIDRDVSKVTDSAEFVRDLGVDSMLALELATRLEHRYAIELDDDEIAAMTTLSRAYELLVRKLSQPS